MVEFLAIKLIRHILATAVFIHKQFTIRQVSIELRDVGLGIGDIRCTAEMVTVVEEDVLNIGGICRDITITRLCIVRIFGLLPLNGWAGDIAFVVELRSLHPTFRHTVVAQVDNNVVITATGIIGVCCCTLHRGNTRRCTERFIILLALFLYFQHTGSIVFLSCRDIVATDAIDIVELACS